MTAAEYRDALAALGLTQVGAARLFGVNERTSRRWALGQNDIPRAVEIVLKQMISTAEPPTLNDARAYP